MRAPLAELPQKFVCGLYGAAAWVAVDACTGAASPYNGGLWHLVAQCALSTKALGMAWAERHATAQPSRFDRIADGIFGASEVLAHVYREAAP
jgi:hypothetical protein